MEKDDFSARLKHLEDRINAAHSTRAEPPPKGPSEYTQTSIAWRMVTELVVGMLLGMAIGYGLDSLFGTRPVFLVLFSLLGFAAGVRTMMRTAGELTKPGARTEAAPGATAGNTGGHPGQPGKE